MTTESNIVCSCAVCRKDILEGQPMGDHKVYKCGELSYIELAHRTCAVSSNYERMDQYWEIDWTDR